MNSIQVSIFNVGHGESILIEYHLSDSEYRNILIDSNFLKKGKNKSYPAIEYLKAKGIKKIDALVFTHFDSDHICGADQIIKEFNIGKLVIPPFISRRSKKFDERFKKILQEIQDSSNRTTDSDVREVARSLAAIIVFIKKFPDKVEEIEGRETAFRINGISNKVGTVYLPLPKTKALINAIIDNGNFEVNNFNSSNDISLAIKFDFFENSILFSGDSPEGQWLEHKRQMALNSFTGLSLKYFKAPHHGSRNDNTTSVYDYLLGPNKSKNSTVFVSANGRSHPHNEFFDLVVQNELKPWCTNLAKQCYKNLIVLPDISNIPGPMKAFLRNYDDERDTIACQGDIRIIFKPNIDPQISSSESMPCVYRI